MKKIATRSCARLFVTCGALALLAACGDNAGETDAAASGETAAVSGEVLDGSISDAMLPLDELQSRAPQAAIVPEDDSDGSGDAASADGSSAANSGSSGASSAGSGAAEPEPAADSAEGDSTAAADGEAAD